MRAIVYEGNLWGDTRDNVPMMEEYCHQKGYEIYKTLNGADTKKYDELMDDVMKKNFDILVCRNILILCKGPRQMLASLKELIDNDIHFVFLESEITSFDPMMIGVIKKFTNFFVKSYTERSKNVIGNLRKQNKKIGGKSKYNKLLTKELLQSKTCKELMQMFNCSPSTISIYRRKLRMKEEQPKKRVLEVV